MFPLYIYFFSCLTDRRRPNCLHEALPAVCCTPRVGGFKQSMTGARKTIAVTITFRWSHKNSLHRRSNPHRPCGTKKTPYITGMFEIPYSATAWRPVSMCVTLPILTSEHVQRTTTYATFCALSLA